MRKADPEDSIEKLCLRGKIYGIARRAGDAAHFSQCVPDSRYSNTYGSSVDLHLTGREVVPLTPDQPITSRPMHWPLNWHSWPNVRPSLMECPMVQFPHNMLSEDILADLNRTIEHSNLSPDIRDELGRTISLSDLSAEVIEELNDTVITDQLPTNN